MILIAGTLIRAQLKHALLVLRGGRRQLQLGPALESHHQRTLNANEGGLIGGRGQEWRPCFQILSVLAQPGFHRRQGLYGSCRYQDIKRGGHRTDGYVENANRGNSKAMECRNERLQGMRSEEHTSELQSHSDLVCRLLLEKK